MKKITLAAIISTLLVQLPVYSLEFPPTGGTGQPTRTASGGRRNDSCVNVQAMQPTALVPQNQLVTTVSQTPTLFFYIPKTKTKMAEFALMDNQGNEIFLKMIALPDTSGVIKLDLPPTVKLETNKTYQWELAIVCDTQERTSDRFIQGTLQRNQLSPDLQARLQGAALLKQAELHAEARNWQDSLAIAAQLRPTFPQAWEELLKSVDLEAIAKEPFVN